MVLGFGVSGRGLLWVTCILALMITSVPASELTPPFFLPYL